MLADQVFPRNFDVENVLEARILFRKGGELVAGRAGRAVFGGVLHLMARLATGRQPFERCGTEWASLRLGLVAFDAVHRRVLAGKRVLRVLVMLELEPGNFPFHRRRMTFRANPFKLTPVRVSMAIRAFRLEVAELGRGQLHARGSGHVTLLTRHVGVFGHQGELRVLVMIKGQLVLFPTRGGMTGRTGGFELLAVWVFVTTFTVLGQTLERRRAQGRLRGLGLVTLRTFERIVFPGQLKSRVRGVSELEVFASPAFGRVAFLAGDRELTAMWFLMAIRAEFVF